MALTFDTNYQAGYTSGILDTLEWSTPDGQADSADLDQDDIPNLWDDDNDGDGVPDVHDLSPSAVTEDYTTLANLSTEGSGFSGYEFIEIQVQPEEQDHLRYSTTALDWPDDDHKGNVQDRDDSTDDLRLTPFLIVTTNVAPQQTLAEKYSFRSWLNDDGKYVLMAPLAPVQDSGAIHSFYAKIAYAPGQTADIQWQAQLVWMAEMQSDYSEDWIVKTRTTTLHEYQDSFRITGLKVTKDQGYEAAVFGVPASQTMVNGEVREADDIELFRLLLGLNDTFKSYVKMDGQPADKTGMIARQVLTFYQKVDQQETNLI
jgi:hypothetical protein